jgi:hypothetical protein
MVDEGPVELTDPARVSVDLGGDEHVAADADIVWDDSLPEPPARVVPKPGRSSTESVDLGVAGPPDAAAARARATPQGGEPRARRPRESAPGTRPPKDADGGRARSDRAGDDRLTRGPKRARAAAHHADPGNGAADVVHEIKPPGRMGRLNRWLLVLVPLLVVGTVAFRYRQQLRQEYPLIAEKGRTDGIPALESGDFDKANQLLSAARSAVDALGGDVQDADEIRQAADEAAIYVKLIPQDLGDLLSEAGRTDPDSWASRFDSLYKGRSILVDTIVTAVPDATSSSAYDLALRIFPPGEAANRDGRPERVAVLDLTGFQLFDLAKPKSGDRVMFGARLESFKYDTDSGLWLIRLMPKSGVFITHPKALDSLGWRDDSTPTADAPKAGDEPKEDRP